MIRYLSVLAFCLISLPAESRELVLERNGLVIEAIVESKAKEASSGRYFLHGKLRITNKSSESLFYSNKNLLLSVSGDVGRAYKDSIASSVVDFNNITLESGQVEIIKVYWVYSQPLSTRKSKLELKWKE